MHQNNGHLFTHVTVESIKNGFRIQDAELRIKRTGLLARKTAALAKKAQTTKLPFDMVLYAKPVRKLIDDIVDMMGKTPKVRAYLRLFCQHVAQQAAGFTGSPAHVYY